MKRHLLTAALLCLLPMTSDAGVVVEGVRAWSEGDATRIVFDMSGGAKHNLFTLREPNRVVIDISGGALSSTKMQLPRNVGVVRNVRAAQRGQTELRGVRDLSAAVQARSFFAGPAYGSGERLVIDLGDRNAREPVKRAHVDNEARDIVIAVDPGHGGRDPGAIGKHKTREKDVVLSIGRKLVEKLNKEPGLSAFLVRDKDVLIPHRERLEAARRANADLFVSIHADAVDDRRARGSSVYALSMKGASDEAAMRLAAQQNASLIGGVSLNDKEPVLASVLMDLSQNATINASLDIGEAVLAELGKVNKLHRSRVQQAGFLVLKSPDVPSILVETAYISNPDEERKLRNPEHQRKLVNAVFTGIKRYYQSNPPVDTLFARNAGAPSSNGARTYTISQGDTLSEIADRYRISINRLRRENALRSDRIRVGQVLKIPAEG